MGHVLAIASGFGLRVIPLSPYRFTLGPTPEQLDVEHESGGKWLFARLSPDSKGGYSCKIGEDTGSQANVLDIESGPTSKYWQIETHVYSFELPPGFVAQSLGRPGDLPFDLLGPHESLIFAQMPQTLPPIDQLRAPDQRVIASGRERESEWIELCYEHDGREWFQRHEVFLCTGAPLVFTSQSRLEFSNLTKEAMSKIRETIEFKR